MNKELGNNSIDSQLIPLIQASDSVVTKNKFRREIQAYIDRNNNVLSASTPAFRLLFSDMQRDKLYDIWKIDKKITNDVKNTIASDKAVRKPIMFEMVNTPHNILCMALIKYYHKKGDKEVVKALCLHIAFHFYSIIHPKYYKFLPNPEVMEYTINRLSNKYLFKQYGVVIKVIEHLAMGNHENMIDTLMKNGDTGALDYLVSLNSRMNLQMKSFSSEYYKDYEEKNAIFSQADNYDADNFILTTNLSGIIESKAKNASVDFFTTRINQQAAALSARSASCDLNVLIDAITNIKNSRTDSAEELMRNILITYLNDPNNSELSLGTGPYVAYCLKVYSKSNTKEPSIVAIKKILGEMLEANSKRYEETNREASKVNYRKALFYYFILSTQKSVKN